MKLFKSKEQKRLERKLVVKKAMNELVKRIDSLRKQEAKYVSMAQTAMREELPDQVKLAREALRTTIGERKRTYKMLLTAEIIGQMKDTAAMTTEFLSAVSVLSKDIAKSASIKNGDVQYEINAAMGKVTEQTEFLEQMLTETQDSVSVYSGRSEDAVTDSDLDRVIYGDKAMPAVDSVADESLDKEIEALKKRISG